jgi:tRNA1Val (adenine37-N6)-methyltransferase
MVKKKYKPFNFKQFSIQQNSAAMKIGTDGILLGAWADTTNSNQIIDIGTGTGVIGIMQCQKNSSANIDAIEISKEACIDAAQNIANCPWSERVNLHESPIQKLISNKKYDHIISNPPFFINSLNPEDSERKKARHTTHLSYVDILGFATKNLSNKGKVSLILPVEDGEKCILISNKFELWVSRKCFVQPKAHKKPHRLLLEFTNEKTKVSENNLIIENKERHDYTEEYKAITKDFYTIF